MYCEENIIYIIRKTWNIKHLPHRPENRADSFPMMNVSNSSKGFSWTGGPFFSDEEFFLYIGEFLPNLICGSKADAAVTHFPCDVLPLLPLQLICDLACQSALYYYFICCHLLEEHTNFLVCIIWLSCPFCLRLFHFYHAGGRDGISWCACVEALITRKPQKEFRHLKITDR